MGQHLGQHFLKNSPDLRKIVRTLALETGDTVIEIGPGHGELTRELASVLSRTPDTKLIAIERDEMFYEKLVNSNWKLEREKVKFIHKDILKILPKLVTNYQLPVTNYKIVGNIPFYLTGRLLKILSELEPKPKSIVLTIQKEVGERICAHPTRMNPTHRKCPMCGMNLLAASVAGWAGAKIAGIIPRNHFTPPPKVDAVILKLVPLDGRSAAPKAYYELVRMLFKQPRQTILNNLARGLRREKNVLREALTHAGVNPDARPQNLSREDILTVSQLGYTETQ